MFKTIRAAIIASVTMLLLLLASTAFAQFGPSSEDIHNMMPKNIPSGPGGMMSPPGGSNFGPNDQEGNFGPDEGQIEEMQKKGQQMQIKGMFRGIKQGMKGMSQGMKMMKSMLNKLSKQGISAPEELTTAMAKAEEIITYLNSIKSADDISDTDAFMDKMSEMADVGPVMQEWGPRLGDLFKLGQLTREAERRLKQAERDIKRASSQAAKAKMDLSDQITELLNGKAALDQALADAKSKTDPDEKQAAIETFFEQMDNVYNTIRLIDSLKNLGQAKATWTRQLKLNDSEIKRLTRRKLDVSELTAAQTEIKNKLSELTTVLSAKPIDGDAVVDTLEEVKNLQSQFDDARDQLLGQESELPEIKTEKFTTPKMDFGMFSQFKNNAPTGEENNDEQ